MVFLRKAILSSVSLIIALFLFSCSYAQIISQIREDNKADIKEIAGDDEGFPGRALMKFLPIIIKASILLNLMINLYMCCRI